MEIKEQISQIKRVPGIYKFFNSKGEILYIGKAVNLRSRVGSYFNRNHPGRPFIDKMVPKISQIKTIETENEVEALILEANLIKKHKPYYNSALKDDKRYAWIYIDTHNPFPKVKKVRELGRKGKYFGPYPDGRPINRILKYIRMLYPYADCNLKFFPDRTEDDVHKKRVCLYYHLGQCTGPCDNLISEKEYRENIDEIIKILEGKRKRHISKLEKRMIKYSREKRFEQAAILRDKVSDLKYLSQRIDIRYGDTEEDFRKIKEERDLAGIYEILRLYDKKNISPETTRIECYDISNISGKLAYGSMTVAIGAQLMNSKYRIFKIKTKNTPDDVKMMNEVLKRRLKHIKSSTDKSLSEKPDVILLDGGKSQLSGIPNDIPKDIIIMGISKGKHLKRSGFPQRDEFWIKTHPKTNQPTAENIEIRRIKIENPFIFQNLRDEAHRFAIKHHRKARKEAQKYSILDEISGVGEERKKLLLRKFKSIKGIRRASEQEINKVINNSRVSKRIKKTLS
jgi:excinuclease ABC subunit C